MLNQQFPSINNFQSNKLFEDDHLIAYNKHSEILSIRPSFHPDKPNLTYALQNQMGKLFICHRLDKETSGIVLYANDAVTLRQINTQFEKRKFNKVYLSVVHGLPPMNEFVIDLPFTVSKDRNPRTRFDSKNRKTSISHITGTDSFTNWPYPPNTGLSGRILFPNTGR